MYLIFYEFQKTSTYLIDTILSYFLYEAWFIYEVFLIKIFLTNKAYVNQVITKK